MSLRRYYVPNSIVFISQVMYARTPVFAAANHLALLQRVIREAKERYPCHMLAYVFLPEHFHLLLKPASGVTY